MPAVPALIFLAAAVLCSMIGRMLLVSAAFGVSAGWGCTVLFVPFGPLIFRMNHRELAHPTRYWRMATGPLLLLFFLNGGSSTSLQSLTGFGKPVTANASMSDTHFHLPVPSQVVASIMGHADSTGAQGPATSATPAPVAFIATPAPSKAVTAAAAAMPTAPKIMTQAERVEANRKEFARLADWYDNLKHERGYLRKGDNAAVEAYNAEASKYQAALQLAKNEQAELAKLTARK